MTASRKLEAIAHHEAGHAVVGWVCNPQVRHKHVTIIPGDGNLGHVLRRRSNISEGGMEFADNTRGCNLRDSEAIT